MRIGGRRTRAELKANQLIACTAGFFGPNIFPNSAGIWPTKPDMNGQEVMQKRQEVLRRPAARSVRKIRSASLRRLYRARRLARLCICENGTVTSKLLRSHGQAELLVQFAGIVTKTSARAQWRGVASANGRQTITVPLTLIREE